MHAARGRVSLPGRPERRTASTLVHALLTRNLNGVRERERFDELLPSTRRSAPQRSLDLLAVHRSSPTVCHRTRSCCWRSAVPATPGARECPPPARTARCCCSRSSSLSACSGSPATPVRNPWHRSLRKSPPRQALRNKLRRPPLSRPDPTKPLRGRSSSVSSQSVRAGFLWRRKL